MQLPGSPPALSAEEGADSRGSRSRNESFDSFPSEAPDGRLEEPRGDKRPRSEGSVVSGSDVSSVEPANLYRRLPDDDDEEPPPNEPGTSSSAPFGGSGFACGPRVFVTNTFNLNDPAVLEDDEAQAAIDKEMAKIVDIGAFYLEEPREWSDVASEDPEAEKVTTMMLISRKHMELTETMRTWKGRLVAN